MCSPDISDTLSAAVGGLGTADSADSTDCKQTESFITVIRVTQKSRLTISGVHRVAAVRGEWPKFGGSGAPEVNVSSNFPASKLKVKQKRNKRGAKEEPKRNN